MSTCNFSLPSTKFHYTIGVDQELEQWDFDDIIENVKSELYAIGAEDVNRKWAYNDTQNLVRFAVKYYDREYKQWDEGYITVQLESGYYQGAMFDIDSEDLDDLKLPKYQQVKIANIRAKIEKILEQNTTKIRRVAVFSNGEGLYELA